MLLLLPSVLLAVPTITNETTEVRTNEGALRGLVDVTGKRIFRGIPFALPPIGPRRFRPAERLSPWNGVLNATSYGATCVQPGGEAGWATIQGRNRTSEDCLYVNVVAPATRSDATGWPVMVYLHAGEFHYGSAWDLESNYPYFADDVILVAANSRLGPLGYLASDDLRRLSPTGSTGMLGIQDQRLALRWVKENIAHFGGDPARITLWGESSGGTSVAMHLVLPQSWGLFDRVIMQSPGLTQVKSMEHASTNYEFMLAALLASKSPSCARGDGFVRLAGVAMSRHSTPLNCSADPPQTRCDARTVDAAAACDSNPRCDGYAPSNRHPTAIRPLSDRHLIAIR